jgi:hypothetical protein
LPFSKVTKKFKEALKKGIPASLRGDIWQQMIGNDLRITQKLYTLLLERAHHFMQ